MDCFTSLSCSTVNVSLPDVWRVGCFCDRYFFEVCTSLPLLGTSVKSWPLHTSACRTLLCNANVVFRHISYRVVIWSTDNSHMCFSVSSWFNLSFITDTASVTGILVNRAVTSNHFPGETPNSSIFFTNCALFFTKCSSLRPMSLEQWLNSLLSYILYCLYLKHPVLTVYCPCGYCASHNFGTASYCSLYVIIL